MMIEVPVSSVREDPSFPDLDTRHIFEHLKYTLSLPCQFPMPAIKVVRIQNELVVSGGHKYLRIANELGRATIRAIFSSEGSTVTNTLPVGARIVPREVLEHEVAMPVVRDFHVYFFDEPLSDDAKKLFLSKIAGFFVDLKTPLFKPSDQRLISWDFPFEGRCAQFEANIPVGDKSWLNEYLRVSREFSRRVVPIVSFQGARFPG
jgi:hypothetical protein